MIYFGKLKSIFALLILQVLFVVACSSDEKSVAESNGDSFETLSELSSDSPCNSSREGITVFVEADSSNYVCKKDSKKSEYKWVLKDEDYTDDNGGTAQDTVCADVKSSSSSDSLQKKQLSSSSVHLSSSVQMSSSSAKKNWNEGSLKDSRDGHVYRTVTIGNQTWMAENLNYVTANSKCYKDSCEKYGRLYTWADAIDSVGLANDADYPIVCGDGKECGLAHDFIRGIKKNGSVQGVCPAGWRIPAREDFYVLYDEVLKEYPGATGKALRTTSGWPAACSFDTTVYGRVRTTCVDGNGIDAYGFSVISAKGEEEYWTSSEESEVSADIYFFNSYRMGYNSDVKSASLTVRCIKGDAFGRPTVAEPLVDARDGQVYKTVVIGEQTWMAENLSYNAQGSLCYGEYYPGYYAEEEPGLHSTCTNRYYSWSTAVGLGEDANKKRTYLPETVQGICPKGWHVPSKNEFEILLEAVGGSEKAGTMLKSLSGWIGSEYKDNEFNIPHYGTWNDVPSNGISDAYGFNALPKGGGSLNNALTSASKMINGKQYKWPFSGESRSASFYSSTDDESTARLSYFIHLKSAGSLSNGDEAEIGKTEKDGYLNIRCVKDGGKYVVSSDSSVAIEKGRFTDDRDGQSYGTVKIGKQIWMAENLNYEIKNSRMKSYCYQDQDSNCTKYGRLYTWGAAMDSAGIWSENGMGCGYKKSCTPTFPVRGICPSGWHLPDTTEWLSLVATAGGEYKAGDHLKDPNGWTSGGENTYGFSALNAGKRNGDYRYSFTGTSRYEIDGANFWSSNDLFSYRGNSNGKEGNYFYAYCYNISNYPSLFKHDYSKDDALSVRCIKD